MFKSTCLSLKSLSLSAAALVCILGSLGKASVAIASPEELSSTNEVPTEIELLTPVASPEIVSSEISFSSIIPSEQLSNLNVIELLEPSSYTEADLLLEENQLAQTTLNLEAFCAAYPFNSRCIDRPVIPTPQPAPPVVTTPEVDTDLPERDNRFYVRLGGGRQSREAAQDFIGRGTFENGYNLYGAAGYRFSDIRAELEYKYFNNNFDTLTFFVPGTTTPVPGPAERSPGAFVDGRAIMFNLYYDIPTGSRFRPYVGAGLGFYQAFINNLSPPGFGGFVAFGRSSDRFAYQLQAGLGYALTNNLDVLLGYRYFRGNEFDYVIEGFEPNLRPNGLETNTIELNLLYNF